MTQEEIMMLKTALTPITSILKQNQPTITFGEWMTKYLEGERKGTVSAKSYHQLELLQNKIPSQLQELAITTITPIMLQKFLNNFAVTASESYIQKMYGLLRSTFEAAVENDICIKNAARKLKSPHKPEKSGSSYELEEVQKIISFALTYYQGISNKRHRRAAMQIAVGTIVLLVTGIRRGELLGLDYVDLNVQKGIIHIRRAVYCDDDGIPRVTDGKAKTHDSIRDVPCPSWVMKLILNIPKTCDYPFGTSVGTLIYPSNFNRSYNKFMKESGIHRLNVHSCRHTTATLMQELGANLRDVQVILGHTRPETTARYSHPSAAKLHKTSDAYFQSIIK